MRAPARQIRLFNLRHPGAIDIWGPHLPVPESGLSVASSYNVVGDVLRFRVELWLYQDRMAQGTQPQHSWARQNAEDPDLQLRSKIRVQFINAFNQEPVEPLLSYETKPVFADLGRHPVGFRPNVTGMGICGLKLGADIVVHPDARSDTRTLSVNLLIDKDLFARRPTTNYPPLYCHLRLTRLESWGLCGAADVPGPIIAAMDAAPRKAKPAAKLKASAVRPKVAARKTPATRSKRR